MLWVIVHTLVLAKILEGFQALKWEAHKRSIVATRFHATGLANKAR